MNIVKDEKGKYKVIMPDNIIIDAVKIKFKKLEIKPTKEFYFILENLVNYIYEIDKNENK